LNNRHNPFLFRDGVLNLLKTKALPFKHSSIRRAERKCRGVTLDLAILELHPHT